MTMAANREVGSRFGEMKRWKAFEKEGKERFKSLVLQRAKI